MSKRTIEQCRQFWADVARQNNWYSEPFFVQIWVDPETNEIYDSVSFGGMTRDIIVTEPRDVDEDEFDEGTGNTYEFDQGAKYVLRCLAEFWEEIELTDVWAEFFGPEEEDN